MRYSVYNVDSKLYDYFEGPGPSGTHAKAPPVRTGSKLGPAPEQAAWPLPMSAKRVGSGPLAQGRIATTTPGLGLGDFGPSGGIVGLGIAAYVAWRILR